MTLSFVLAISILSGRFDASFPRAGAYKLARVEFRGVPLSIRRVLELIAATIAFVVYVWFAAVHNVGRVKRRKRARRVSRLSGAQPRSRSPRRSAPGSTPIA
jgi:hypothetical protein